MRAHYEAWRDADNSISLGLVEATSELRQKELLSASAVRLYEFWADSHEEAMAIHHIKMGWEPYKPVGIAADCPNNCGAVFYPEGSGECPNCGRIKRARLLTSVTLDTI